MERAVGGFCGRGKVGSDAADVPTVATATTATTATTAATAAPAAVPMDVAALPNRGRRGARRELLSPAQLSWKPLQPAMART